MLVFNRLVGILALASLLTGQVTRKSGMIWYLDIALVSISILSEAVALLARLKGRKKNAA